MNCLASPNILDYLEDDGDDIDLIAYEEAEKDHVEEKKRRINISVLAKKKPYLQRITTGNTCANTSRRSSVTAHVARRWTAFAYPSMSTITSPRRTHLSKSLTSTTLVPFRTRRMSLSSSVFLLDGWNSIGAKTQPPFGRVIASYSILGVSAPQA
jgi:hypothetical protein